MANHSVLQEILEHPGPIGLVILGVFVLSRLYALIHHPLSSFKGPFLSHISDFPLALACRGAHRSAWVKQQHEVYGSAVRIAPNHISISKPEAINQIYGHKTGFTKGQFYEDRKKKYIGLAFSARHLQDFEEHMNPSIAAFAVQCQRAASGALALDFCRWCKLHMEEDKKARNALMITANFLAFDVIGDYAFGQPFGFLETGRDDINLIHTVDTRGEVLNALGHLPTWLRPCMPYLIFDPFWYKGLRATSVLASLGVRSEAKRRSENTDRKDLMSFLLNAKDPETGNPLPRSEVVAEAISFIVGGSDTTSSTMTNFMDFVSRDLHHQETLYEELLEAFPEPLPEHWVAEEKITSKLPLLNATLKEVMRLRPTSSTGLERVVPEGGQTVAGVYLPGGALVSVPTVMIHHNSDIFDSPETFRPRRWLDDGASELADYFIPFSVGPRACIGRNFAWMEMTKTLGTLFRMYQFRRSSDIESRLREGFFVKVSECEVTVTCR